MLKVLDVEGAVTAATEHAGGRSRGSGWSYDGERYAAVTAVRRAEQDGDGRLRRRRPLPDAHPPGAARRPRAADDCGRCSVCTGPRFGGAPDPALVERAGRHLRSRDRSSSRSRRWRPTQAARCAGSPTVSRIDPGWALARLGDGGLVAGGRARAAGGRGSTTRSFAGLAEIVRRGEPRAAWVTAVPSARYGWSLRWSRSAWPSGWRGGGGGRAGNPAPGSWSAGEPAASPAGDGQRGAAGGQRAGRLRVTGRPPPGTGVAARRPPQPRAGRWRWSAGSCGGPARSGSCRSRWRP
jgi:hypothetical protein